MNEDQFSAMLAIIVPPIIEQITKNSNDYIYIGCTNIFCTSSRRYELLYANRKK